VRLHERISSSRAAQLFYTATLVDAETLHEWGLVNEVLPGDRLMDRARALARQIRACSPEAVRHIKALTARASERKQRFEAELECFAKHIGGNDLARGLFAFRAKQPPLY
jgi:enoyl-CoA hydratase/carnithine racemase